MPGSRLRRAAALAATAGLALAGCGGGASRDGTVARSAVKAAKKGETPKGAVTEQAKTSAGNPAHRVKIKVVHGPGGAVLAAVPVTIGGKGPFPFILDTGASQSAIDKGLAQRLGLQRTGDAGQVQGVGGATRAVGVVIKRWRAGDVPLRPLAGVALGMTPGDSQAGLAGLLGSDVLSGFDLVSIDYQKQVVTLRPSARGR